MKIVGGLVLSAVVLAFCSLVGWIDIQPINDSIWIGLGAVTIVYYIGTLVFGLTGALIAAIGGAIIGSLESQDTAVGCATVAGFMGIFLAEIIFLVNAHAFVDFFPVVSTTVAIFIAIVTTILGFLLRANDN